MPAADLEGLRPRLEHVPLARRQILQEFHLPMRHAYFIERGAASLLSRTSRDGTLEIAMVGRMGLVGVPIVLGTMRALHRCTVQVPGTAWRIAAADLRQAMARSATLTRVLFNYVQAILIQSSQLALCNACHTLDQRLSRCILMTHDRVEEEIPLTHAALGRILGVRRASVTVAVGRLQEAGLVRNGRGRIAIVDRAGLQQTACECYRLVRAEYDRRIPSIGIRRVPPCPPRQADGAGPGCGG